jgi:hypothetical protein
MKYTILANLPGKTGEEFNIRINEYDTYSDVSINLLIRDNGIDRELNIKKYTCPANSDITDVIEREKAAIKLISVNKASK